MTIQYKLKSFLRGRTAVQLNWELTQLKSTIYIEGARSVNGKSLIGLLSGDFGFGDLIKINFSESDEQEKIEELFNEVGEKVNE